MLSNKFNKPLKFELKPSKIVCVFIVIIHFLALSVLLVNLNIPDTLLILVGLLIVLNFYFSLLKSSSVKFKSYITQVKILQDMQWQLLSSDQLPMMAELQDKWFSLPWFVILYFKFDNNKNKSIIIVPDMISTSDLRRLKLHLALIKS